MPSSQRALSGAWTQPAASHVSVVQAMPSLQRALVSHGGPPEDAAVLLEEDDDALAEAPPPPARDSTSPLLAPQAAVAAVRESASRAGRSGVTCRS
jgi:hypothetical protein